MTPENIFVSIFFVLIVLGFFVGLPVAFGWYIAPVKEYEHGKRILYGILCSVFWCLGWVLTYKGLKLLDAI